MRIISGINKGRNLANPKGMDIRPTTDKTKESLFNIINMNIEDAEFLDLFAGSCSVSFEADSRGASKVVSVDSGSESYRCFLKNNDKIPNNIKYIKSDVIRFLEKNSYKFDYIFLDPPYDMDMEYIQKALDLSINNINDDGVVILETATYRKFGEFYEITDERKYGKSKLVFIKGKK